MCGIGGFVTEGLSTEDVDAYSRSLISTLSHRGPDSQTVRKHDGFSLIHTRLAIRGGSEANQPIETDCGRYLIVYNGEIYNIPFMVSALTEKGIFVEFDGSDTYVLKLWIGCFGLTRVADIEGTFAFAVVDKNSNSLSLIRDRLGVKPLYYTDSPVDSDLVFGFSSELGSLVRAFGIRSDIDNQFLSEYLWFGSGCGNNTIYKDVKSVPPGSIVTFDSKGVSIYRWFDLYSYYIKWRNSTISSLDNAVDAAVKRQTVSDIPIGLFLSSGVDSTILAAIMKKVISKDFIAYTANFNTGPITETNIASQTALSLGINHREFEVETGDVEESILKLLDSYGEPFGDAASIPLLQMCSKLSESGIRVVLQGDGGDELFAGYNRYKFLSVPMLNIIGTLPKCSFKFLPTFSYLSRLRRWYDILVAKSADSAALMLTEETREDSPFDLLVEPKRALFDTLFDPFKVYKEYDAMLRNVDSRVDRQILIDLQVQLPTQFLPKVDRASMCAGVEARVPLLDELLLQASFGIRAKHKVSVFDTKIVLKKLLKKLVPSYRIKKRKFGFSTPYHIWLANDLYEKSRVGVFNPEFISFVGFDVDKIVSLFDIPKGKIDDKMYLRWKIYVLSLWFKKYGSSLK